MKKSTPIHWLATAVCTLGCLGGAQAQSVMKLIVPFSPGGGTDNLARALSRGLQAEFGETVIVENKPGAGGNIALDFVAAAPPDGKTLVFTTNSLVINALIYTNIKFNPEKSFAPVIALAHSPVVIIGKPSLPYDNLADLLKYAKANPGKLSYASCGNGSIHQLAGEQLKTMAGVDILHVPYKGCSVAMTDVAGGTVDLGINSLTSANAFLTSNKVKGLAVTDAKPSGLAPSLPTVMAATGLKNYSFDGWYAVLAPAGTPEAMVKRLNAALNKSLSDDEVKKALVAGYLEPLGGAPSRLAELISTETAIYRPIVKAANIKGD